MLQASIDLFQSWNEKKIRYCHWKSNEHLMEGLDGLTDLDVYVAPADQKIAEEALANLHYVKFVPQKGARYPMVDEWIGFDYESGKLLHVHLHYQIITGTKHSKEFVFPIDELMLNTRVQDRETKVYLIAPELELIVLYSRIVLKAKDKRNVVPNNDYKKEIAYLKERVGAAALEQYCNALLGARGVDFIALLDKEELSAEQWFAVYKIVESWLRPYRKYNKLTARLRYRYYYLRNVRNAVFNRRLGANFIGRKTRPEQGLSICFLGSDGCGKSTVSQEIEKWLTWKIEAKRFYLGSGDHYHSILKLLMAKAQGTKKHLTPANESAAPTHSGEKQEKPVKVGFKRRLLRWGYDIVSSTYCRNIAVRAYKEVKKASRYVKHGGIALFDRFPQNQFRGLYDGPKVRVRCFRDGRAGVYVRLMAWSEERAIAKTQNYQPNLMFKLHLPPEESIRRKPDHTLEEVAPKAAITPKLVFANSKVHDIDATQEYASELLEIKRLIWNEVVQ